MGLEIAALERHLMAENQQGHGKTCNEEVAMMLTDPSGRSQAGRPFPKWRVRALLGATALTAAVSLAALRTANSANVTKPAITNSVTAPAAAPAFAPGMPPSFANL